MNLRGVEDFFDTWASIARAAKASQPHWITPLATVTPRLEQEFRYDEFFEHTNAGADIRVDDGGKGLEFIPTMTNEVLINLPPHNDRTIVKPANGWSDWPAITIKQRLLSANEENGNYIVTAFLGFTAPTGQVPFTNDARIVTPTLAAGKGWGDFDIQATVGVPVPLDHEDTIGVSIVTNVAFQYHIAKYFWPEIEVNYTHWTDGDRGRQRSGVPHARSHLGPLRACERHEFDRWRRLSDGGVTSHHQARAHAHLRKQLDRYHAPHVLTERVADVMATKLLVGGLPFEGPAAAKSLAHASSVTRVTQPAKMSCGEIGRR